MLPALTFVTLIVPGIVALVSIFFDGTLRGRPDRTKDLPLI
jgi:hypothetical protein